MRSRGLQWQILHRPYPSTSVKNVHCVQEGLDASSAELADRTADVYTLERQLVAACTTPLQTVCSSVLLQQSRHVYIPLL